MITFPYKIIDLTHTLAENSPSWGGNCGFKNQVKLDYSDCPSEFKFRVQQIKMHAGIGTHMDAPAHCIPGGETIDEIPLSNLIAPCVVIDVSEHIRERYSVSCDDIKLFEKKYGRIIPHSFVMIRTGWEQFWDQPEKYRNNHIFPSVLGEAAQFLLDREVVGLGIDTLSPDRPENGFPVHTLFLGAGKYIIENAANLKNLPPINSFILSLPLKTKGGTEAPMRLIGLCAADSKSNMKVDPMVLKV